MTISIKKGWNNEVSKDQLLNTLLNESAVVTSTYTLETLTPLMMHGWKEDTSPHKTAELRASSIRGVYRYWWRAVQYDITNSNLLLEKEGELFGKTKGNSRKSLVLLSTPILIGKTKEMARPHAKNPKLDVIAIVNQTFDVVLTFMKKDVAYQKELEAYFELTLLLAGFGQRSRRGAGAVQQQSITYDTVDQYREAIMKQLTILGKAQYFKKEKTSKTHILEIKNDRLLRRPTLRNVYIGRSYRNAGDARKVISEAGHEYNNGKLPKQYLGRVKGGRKASPLIGTVRKIGEGYYPIISEVIDQNTMSAPYKEARNNFLKWVGVEL